MGIILMLASQCHYHCSWFQTFSNELLQVVLLLPKKIQNKNKSEWMKTHFCLFLSL